MNDLRTRSSWCGDDELYVAYHDCEWGVPIYDDDALFELLSLEGAQAGLSWLTVLRRRDGYRRAFDNFRPDVVSRFDDARVDVIMGDVGVIRHRQKIVSVIANARAIIDVQREHGSFGDYLWAIATSVDDGNEAAAVMSAQLRAAGLKFVGVTICHSFMQASGMRNDHNRDCFRYDEIEALRSA